MTVKVKIFKIHKKAYKKIYKGNYKRDISAGDVAGILGIRMFYFSKIFKQLFDDTFINYLTNSENRKGKGTFKGCQF